MTGSTSPPGTEGAPWQAMRNTARTAQMSYKK